MNPTTESLDVASVVIGLTIFPAAEVDSHPSEGQRSYRRPGGVFRHHAGGDSKRSPVTKSDLMSSPFVEGVTNKAGSGAANVNPFRLPFR